MKKGFKEQQEKAKEGGFDYEDGVYFAQLVGLEFAEAKQSGRPQLEWTWLFLEGDNKGKKTMDFDGLDREDALVWVMRKLSQLGYAIDELQSPEELVDLVDEIVEEKICAKIRLKTKGEYQNLLIDRVVENSEEYLGDGDTVQEPSSERSKDDSENATDKLGHTDEEIDAMSEEELTELNDNLDNPFDLDEIPSWEGVAEELKALNNPEPEESEETDEEQEKDTDEDDADNPFSHYTKEEVLEMTDEHEDVLTELNASLEEPFDLDEIDSWEEAAQLIADAGFSSEEDEDEIAEGSLVLVEYKGKDVEAHVEKIKGEKATVALHGKKHKGKEIKVGISELTLVD